MGVAEKNKRLEYILSKLTKFSRKVRGEIYIYIYSTALLHTNIIIEKFPCTYIYIYI